MKKYFILIVSYLFVYQVFGQIAPNALGYYVDALRFSETRFGGTARFMGIGGAATALGADATSSYLNPAGLGFNRRSEFTVTGGLMVGNSNSKYLGESTGDTRLNFSINNFGLIFANDRGTAKVRSSAFAITFSRLNDFNNSFTYSAVNKDNSLIDYIMERSDGVIPWTELDAQDGRITTLEGLAYYSYLINPFFGDNTTRNSYYSFVPQVQFANIRQKETVASKGSQNQWNLSYGMNLFDKIYLGASLGIQTFKYDRQKTYSETTVPANTPLNNFTLTEKQKNSGIGANLTIGAVFRPVDFIRIGISAVTPTLIRVKDTYSAEIDVFYNNYPFEEFINGQPRTTILRNQYYETAFIYSEYNITTPFRANGGLAIFMGKLGFLSADIEYVDFTTARLSNPNVKISFDGDNKTIQSLYQKVFNYRSGAEFRYKNYRFRGGVAYYGDPFKPSTSNPILKRSRIVYNAGFGFRNENNYWDIALSAQSFDTSYNPYVLSGGSAPTVATNNFRLHFVFSYGVFW